MSHEAINIPFQVSARTARLIGRENIATSKGAIIELVKNGYDADSDVSVVWFDNQYSELNSEINCEYHEHLLAKSISNDYLNEVYRKEEDHFVLNENADQDVVTALKKELSKLNSLYIIDAGEGMTQNTIRKHWMTIGTDNKSLDIFTKSGRVKAGAKGIGRFALDKLGSKCEMVTVFNPNSQKEIDSNELGIPTGNVAYEWKVNWEDFEGEFKTIDKVGALLTPIVTDSLKAEIEDRYSIINLSKAKSVGDYRYGTILKITDLREDWEDYYVQQVYSDLEVLVPPREAGGFSIYVFSTLKPKNYGEVLGSICDDYDYKLTAVADDKQNVKIEVHRLEYDVELIPPEFFTRPAFQNSPFRKEEFLKGIWNKEVTFSQLLPGFKRTDEKNSFEGIGDFNFSFYFLKRGYSTPDANRFFYRKFQANTRREWLDNFGGIKLFRDNFRVRPYGETKDVAFDWLGLGNRKAQSPAGVAKKEGGYRVEPENVAGAIKISRLTNLNFEDKSSREGLQENQIFQVFKTLIAAIINVFEEDRAYIAREMEAFDSERYSEQRTREEAEAIVQKVLKDTRARKSAAASNTASRTDQTEQSRLEDTKDQQLEIIAELNERKDEEIEKLKEEQKVLRGLASSGIVLASFSHDLSKLNDLLGSRVEKLKSLISDRIHEADYGNVENRKNPFYQLETIKHQDLKLQNWLNFSLGAARKDKRKRRQLFLKKYFNDFSGDWSSVLENRGIDGDFTQIDDLDLRVFEIDIDSIFNNLLVNSIDAFRNSKVNRPRKIVITATSNSREIVLDYYDNGPGLSQDIVKPEIIFEPLFTTRRNPFTGEEEGTGLGMWLIKSIVEENDGSVKLLFPKEGFGLRIAFPIKYKR